MKYKPETIRKYMEEMRAAVDELLTLPDEEFEQVRTVISAGDRKIGRTRNVSQAPGYTCGNCRGCIWHCMSPPVGMMQCPGDCAWCLEHHRGCPWGESAWTWKH